MQRYRKQRGESNGSKTLWGVKKIDSGQWFRGRAANENERLFLKTELLPLLPRLPENTEQVLQCELLLNISVYVALRLDVSGIFLEFILGCRNNSLMSQSVIKALEQLLHWILSTNQRCWVTEVYIEGTDSGQCMSACVHVCVREADGKSKTPLLCVLPHVLETICLFVVISETYD